MKLQILKETSKQTVGPVGFLFCIDRCSHRLHGPTVIQRYINSNEIMTKEYRQKNRLHRLDGPAKIWYEKNLPHVKNYFVDGIFVR